ncbi:hypothetical protein AVENLUH5627_02668 [Acinetobacter venetianus]|uniref:DUF559 domain-containing protein n=1 Tax=Acinetobacter venetianus TaxID=52133 RepID=A0A150HLB5_9GAMM|nr:hypothetical protein [Acinetobacter venetianus]KXZ65938.1 hypothetical protein AVENLUH5627_02668 [Acinetobacter venetianus]
MTTFKEAQRSRSKPVARSNVPYKPRKSVSKGEALLENHLNALRIPFTKEFRFYPDRKWQADFRIDDMPILVEVEGGVFSNGRHTRGEGYTKDCEKYSAAAVNGWYVIRGTTAQIKAGLVIQWIEALIKRLRGG